MPARNRRTKPCEVCGIEMRIKASHFERRKTCSKKCDHKRRETMYLGKNNPNFGNRGPKNPLFKTGERMSRYGYKMIYKPDHPNSQRDGYILEHRFVMSEHLRRPLDPDEHIHHIDGDKLNNDISNLQVITQSEHSKLHNAERELLRDNLGRIVGCVLIDEIANERLR